MKIKYLIFNYNLPTETDEIHHKLVADGIHKNDIFVVDNGSDKAEKSKYTRIFVEKNENLPPAFRAGVDYLLANEDFDYCVGINLSTKLLDDFHYPQAIEKTINDAKTQLNDFAFITSSVLEHKYVEDVTHNNTNTIIWYPSLAQPMLVIYRKEFLIQLKNNARGYYMKEYNIRPHPGEEDMKIFAMQDNKPWAVSHILKHIWLYGQINKKGMAGESRQNYVDANSIEIRKYYLGNYGVFCGLKLLLLEWKARRFIRKQNKNIMISRIIPSNINNIIKVGIKEILIRCMSLLRLSQPK